MRNQPTNVVSSTPDYMLGWKAGQQVLVPRKNIAGDPWTLLNTSFPMCLPPNGTIDANGALSLGTGLATTYAGGIWMRFPAGAVVGDSQGLLYWVVMSSPTAGIVYGPGVSTAPGFIPRLGVASGQVVGSGSAYTQTTGADVTMARFTIPGGSLGPNGAMRLRLMLSGISNANTKQFKLLWHPSGTIIWAQTTITTNPFYGVFPVDVRNRGLTRQVASNWAGAGAASVSPLIYSTFDTAVAQDVICAMQLAVATDFVVLEGITVDIAPQD